MCIQYITRSSEFVSLSQCTCVKDDSHPEDFDIQSTPTPLKILRSKNQKKSLEGRYSATQCLYCSTKSKGYDVDHSEKVLREIRNGVVFHFDRPDTKEHKIALRIQQQLKLSIPEMAERRKNYNASQHELDLARAKV